MVQNRMESNHIKIGPFHNGPLFDHSKSGRIWFSDPHCTFSWFVPDLAEALDCDAHFWRKLRRQWDPEPLPAGNPGPASARNSGSGQKSRTWEPERAVPAEQSRNSPCWRWGRWDPTPPTFGLKSYIKNFARTSKTLQWYTKLLHQKVTVIKLYSTLYFQRLRVQWFHFKWPKNAGVCTTRTQAVSRGMSPV